MAKSKASLAIAPDVAEASPALPPSRPRRSALKKSVLSGFKEKDTKAKKRPAAEVEENEGAPASSKKSKSIVQAEEAEEGEGGDTYLRGFSSGSDSSDEDDEDGVDSAPFDLGKLPTIAKDDATVRHKLDKAKRQPVRNFLYIFKDP